MNLYQMLDVPAVYRAAQALLAPGGEAGLRRICDPLLRAVPAGALMLDAGCGPAGRLDGSGAGVVGTDVSFRYVRERARREPLGVVASVTDLPFADASFDVVWNFGLLHHLADADVDTSVGEFRRVARPGGRVIIVDAVFPENPVLRPLAYWIRRWDRGRHVRTEAQQRRLLGRHGDWRHCRHTFALNGLEVLLSIADVD